MKHFILLQLSLKKQNSLIKARTGFTLTIPVVVHIVLPNTGIISNAQVISQIDALNTDYAGLNGDSTNIPAAFKPFFGMRTYFTKNANNPADLLLNIF